MLTTGDAVPSNIIKDLRTNNKAGNKDYMLKSDFVKPLKNGGIIELGAKVENRIVKNDFVAEVFTNNTWTIYGQIDNDIKYSEEIGAAYLQYKSHQ